MVKFKGLQIIFILLNTSFAYELFFFADDQEKVKIDVIVEIINSKLNNKGWNNVIIIGQLPDYFYRETQHLHYTFVIISENGEEYDNEIDGTERFLSNTLIIDCVDLNDFENKFNIARNVPNWHPHTHTIIYYHGEITKLNTAKIFFMLWYYRCCNAIFVQDKDPEHQLIITHYSPYISKNYKLDYHFGCWTSKKITFPVINFNESYVCMEGCQNITLPVRTNFLGTCIGLGTRFVNYNSTKSLQGINFFEDKGKNLYGFPLIVYASQVVPFLYIDDNGNGTYTFRARDGVIYTEMSKAMNFTIDVSPGLAGIKMEFDFDFNIQRIYAFAQRKVDLIFTPIYQFDLVIVEVDLTVPFKESGVCFLSHLADYDTVLFDLKLMKSNYKILLNIFLCFAGSWLTFFVFNAVGKETITYDQIGKDLINTIRSMLCIPLHKPPKRQTFRIYLLVATWSFFLISFVTQAAIISFFSVYKRGENVETFDDIIEKGYKIEGFASPDVMLPETEEKFRKINEKLVPIQDILGCVKKMSNDSKRFCLIDCSVGRYYERNQLNAKGERYLHIARDQVHSHYLTMMLHKNCALTDQFNKYMLRFVEGWVNY
ncbi:hypothetical protein ACJJTC_004849 [Scirpophaga incertulas]